MIPADHPDYQTWLLAKAVESSVFTALLNAAHKPDEERRCFAIADTLESKFKTEHGSHYTAVIASLSHKWGMPCVHGLNLVFEGITDDK